MPLVGCPVIGSHAARLAVHETILADANIQLRLAQAAEFFALALVFLILALAAAEFGWTGSVTHATNLPSVSASENVPLVTRILEAHLEAVPKRWGRPALERRAKSHKKSG
jgi:hypothetical protein